MRLLRLVVVDLCPKQQGWQRFRVTDGGVTLGTVARLSADDSTRLLLCADVPLECALAVSSSGVVLVPEDVRATLEASLERIVDLIALSCQARRRMWSPVPCVFLLPEDDRDRDWLASKKGLKGSAEGDACAQTDCRFEINSETLSAFTDRWDGTALLADAVSLQGSMGQFRELNRFFERAFARSSGKLVEPMAAFLTSSPLGFTVGEVRRWTVELRHKSVHADRNRVVIRGRHVARAASRMLAAGYDILLNKAHWHCPDPARRDVWHPVSGSHDADGREIFVTPGQPARLAFVPYDSFGVYPLALDVTLHEPPIAGAWPSRLGYSPGEGEEVNRSSSS